MNSNVKRTNLIETNCSKNVYSVVGKSLRIRMKSKLYNFRGKKGKFKNVFIVCSYIL